MRSDRVHIGGYAIKLPGNLTGVFQLYLPVVSVYMVIY